MPARPGAEDRLQLTREQKRAIRNGAFLQDPPAPTFDERRIDLLPEKPEWSLFDELSDESE
jgi:hypothetical protein